MFATTVVDRWYEPIIFGDMSAGEGVDAIGFLQPSIRRNAHAGRQACCNPLRWRRWMYWSFIQIEETIPLSLDPWCISSREFRENLTWAVVVPGDGEISSVVAALLAELSGEESLSSTPA
jgi:hypothetical protein